MYTTQNAIGACETMLQRRESINIDAPIGGLAYTLRRVIPRLKTLAAHEAHGLSPEEIKPLRYDLRFAKEAVEHYKQEAEALQVKYDDARAAAAEVIRLLFAEGCEGEAEFEALHERLRRIAGEAGHG